MLTEEGNMAPARTAGMMRQEAKLTQPADNLPTTRPMAGEGTPVAEKEETTRKHEYWRRVLTGNPDTVPEDVCERAGANRPELSREQQRYTLCSAVNRSWVADHKAVPREELLADWKKYRAELATELDTAENEQELFVALSEREAEAPRLEFVRRAYQQAYMAAMKGEPEWKPTDAELAELAPQDKTAAEIIVRHARVEGLRERERLLPIAQQLAEGMDVFAAVEEDAFSAPRVFAGAPGLLQAVDRLVGMPEDERQRVAFLARSLDAEARRERGDEPPEEEGLVSRSLRAMRRGASSLGYGALQAINNTGIATLHNVGNSLGGEWGQTLKDGAAAWDLRMQMLEEIRLLTQQEVVPLLPEGASRAERYFLDGVQAVPTAVVACCGGAGFGALALSGMGASVAEARRRAPDTPQRLQLAAGVVAGVVQGGIYLSLGRLGGRMLEQSISRFMRARGSGLGNYSLAGLKAALGFSAEGVKMMLGGKAAAAAELGVHELAARASSTASNIDWEQFGNNLTDIEHNMREAATLLPFLLIGAGHVALRHFRSADTVLGSGKRLLDWKVDEKKVNEILRQENPDVKNELLKESLRKSELWRNERLFCMIFPAMKLLNMEGRQVFRKASDVCDFLQLPASFAAKSGGAMAAAAAGRARTGRALREEWEQQAGMWDGPGNLEQLSVAHGLGQRVLMNGRGRYGGHYYFRYDHPLHSGKLRPFSPTEAPEMAPARRQEVTARFDELRALSARLLQLYSDDVCTAANGCDTEVLRAEAEQTRRRYLEMAADCVSARARGKTEKEVFDTFARDCGALLSRYREGNEVQRTGWLQNVPQEYLDNIERYCLSLDNNRMRSHPELREFFWLMYRTRVCAAVLGDLLPSMEDFQTLLTTQHSPADAYRHLLGRELPELQNNSEPARKAVASPGNARRVALYSRLTGVRTETTQGDHGQTLYRMRRPDGRMTPWHDTPQAMVNDVAGNAAFSFMPVGTPLDEWLKRGFDDSACLSTLPAAGEHEYSGHDRLCAAALQELSCLWLEDASHLQPGLLRESRYRAERVLREGRNARPVLELTEPGRFHLESKSSLTPYSLALGRFVVYWTHQITGGCLSPERAADFLVNEGIISPEERQQILDMGKAPLMPRGKNIPLKDTPPADLDGRNRKLGEGLGLFTLRYFFARLPELPVPESMKRWYAQTAFSPDYRRLDGPPRKGRSLDIHKSRNQHSLLGWVNHQAVHQLRDLAPYIRQYRKRYAGGLPDKRIEELMPGAYSADPAQRMEQAWAHWLYGNGVFYHEKPQHWAMLRFPASAWQEMQPAEQALLYQYLQNGPGLDVKSLPGVVPEGVPPELVNLEEVLRKYPVLHNYSYVDARHARTLNVQEPRVVVMNEGEKVGNYEVSSRIRANYEEEVVPMPAFIATNETMLQALHTLDLLRHYPRKDKAYFDGERIWWKGKSCGLHGIHPAGLEKWTPYVPMQALILNLWRVRLDATTGGEEDSVDVNGVEMPILTVEELNPPSLKAITMYRHENVSRRLYRLMPGMNSGVDEVTRNPYVVGLCDGVYEGTEDYFSQRDEISVLKVPLEDFRHYVYYLPFDPDMDYLTLRRRQVRYFLEQVFSLADEVSAGKRGLGWAHGTLTELLMSLYEDTRYTWRLEGRYPFDLETGEARALALAGNIFACLSAPLQSRHYETREAFLYLKQEAERLRSNKEHLYDLVEALVTGNNATDETRESLKNYLDEEAEAVAETSDSEGPAESEQMSFRDQVAREFGIPIITRKDVEEMSELAGQRAEEAARKLADPEYRRRREEGQEKLRLHREKLKRMGI